MRRRSGLSDGLPPEDAVVVDPVEAGLGLEEAAAAAMAAVVDPRVEKDEEEVPAVDDTEAEKRN